MTIIKNDEPSPQKPRAAPKNPPKSKKPADKPAAKSATKRSSTGPAPKSTKRQKRAATEPESELSDVSFDDGEDEDKDVSAVSEEASPKPAKKKTVPAKSHRSKNQVVQSDSEDENAESNGDVASSSDVNDNDDDQKDEMVQRANEKEEPVKDDFESDMSEVLDAPIPKRGRPKSTSAETKVKPKTKAKAPKASKASAAAAATKDVSPDEAEMKRLQGWLVKCGIRKIWSKYLAPYETPKAKIKHLKDMLKDAGMDGRYSNEKASAIKEQRELAADLEAVQEGAKIWGHDGDEEEEVPDVKPKRRAAAAARFVDFGDSGEESD